MDLRELLEVERRVVQAGMASLGRAELASAVSLAGGLGMLGTLRDPEELRRDIRQCREQCAGRPYGVNLLLVAARRAHVEVCIAERVPVVSLFFGHDARLVRALHEVGSVVLHQVGSVQQGERALADRADALIAQGSGAGGHVLAEEAGDTLLPKLAAIAGGRPILASGGIVDRASAERAVASGAAGVWAGTRFLLTPESHAHPAYKARLLEADRTIETLLFGLGWHARHRVVPNAATERWCGCDPLGPRWVRALNRCLEPLSRLAPSAADGQVVAAQRLGRPLYSPFALVRGMDERLVDVTPLYAGASVARLGSLMPARDVVHELSV